MNRLQLGSEGVFSSCNEPTAHAVAATRRTDAAYHDDKQRERHEYPECDTQPPSKHLFPRSERKEHAPDDPCEAFERVELPAVREVIAVRSRHRYARAQ